MSNNTVFASLVGAYVFGAHLVIVPSQILVETLLSLRLSLEYLPPTIMKKGSIVALKAVIRDTSMEIFSRMQSRKRVAMIVPKSTTSPGLYVQATNQRILTRLVLFN